MGEEFPGRKLLREKTQARLCEIAAAAPGVFGLCVLDPATGESFGVNEHQVFPQASAIKIPILMEVYKQAHAGKFKLGDARAIEKTDKTGGSGILFELGDGTVRLSIHDLCVLMILVSDNTATNMLIDLVGMENINRTLQELGCLKTCVRRRMMDLNASAHGDENLSTPAEAVRIMELLHQSKFIDATTCAEILAILKKPKTNRLGTGLPAGLPLASKPGGIGGVTTEWAIVLLKDRPYIVAVMENYGLGEAGDSIKEVSKVLYGYFLRLSRSTPYGVAITAPT